MTDININIYRTHSKISKQDRYRLNNHKSCILWFTGLSGSGKSTLAYELERRLYHNQIRSYVLDGDNIRYGLNQDLGFHPVERNENVRRVAEISKLFSDAGLFVIVALISPLQEQRERARNIIGKHNFLEIYVKCSLEECERRDVKGLYKKAREGTIEQFTGISSPYEVPQKPDIIIESDKMSLGDSIEIIFQYLVAREQLFTDVFIEHQDDARL